MWIIAQTGGGKSQNNGHKMKTTNGYWISFWNVYVTVLLILFLLLLLLFFLLLIHVSSINDWLISYSTFIYNALSIRVGVYVFDGGTWKMGRRTHNVGSGQGEYCGERHKLSLNYYYSQCHNVYSQKNNLQKCS